MKFLFTVMVTFFWSIGITFIYLATKYDNLSIASLFFSNFLIGIISMGMGAIVFSLGIIIFLLQDK